MNLKILFAESRFDQLQYFAGLLKEEGHEVFPYQSGQTVIDTVRGGLEYDLGIIDSTLLGLKQGEEVMRELKQINSDTPMISTSAYPGHIYLSKKELPSDAKVIKPFEWRELANAINKFYPDSIKKDPIFGIA